jgi:DNA-binding SARP family transcriptional activator
VGDTTGEVGFGVLGPFEVTIDGETLDVGGPRLRTMLAMLTADAARVVSVSAFVRDLWGDEAPENADRTVRTYMSRLRKTLTPPHRTNTRPELITTKPPGYVLRLDPDALDAARFERLATTGRQALAAGRTSAASEHLVAALGLWRGVAYAEFGSVEALRAEGMRLERVRNNAVQDRIDADLASGKAAELIAELESLTSSFPGHERLWVQLMTALYRAGRQSDALDAFRTARQVQIDGSGMEPSPLLTDIQRRILAHDASLLVPRPEAPSRASDGRSPPDLGVSLAEVLRAGQQALSEDGDLLTSREHFTTAYRLADLDGDARARAAAAVGLGGLWVHENRTSTGSALLTSQLRHALAAVAATSPLALRLRARLVGESDYEAGEHGRILALVSETRRAGGPLAQAEALSLAHHCLLGPDHVELRDALALELIVVGGRTGRRLDQVMGLLWHTVDLFLAADPHAERCLSELKDLLSARKHLAAGFVVAAIEVMLDIRGGRLDQAEAIAQSCAELGNAAGDLDALGWYGAQLVAIRWFQGRLGELVPVLDNLMHSPTLSPIDNSYYAALAAAAAAAGDRRTAAGALARLCGNDLAALPRSSTWLLSMCGVAETAYLLGDRETAARVYDLLRPFAHLPVMASLAVACFGSTHYPLGTASIALGDLDGAVRHLRAAVQQNLAIAHWPAVVFARRRHARVLLLRASPGDATAAELELTAADREAQAW